MKKIWTKNINQLKTMEDYCFYENAQLDNKLINNDVLGSLAHGYMLLKKKVLREKEYQSIKKVLLEILLLSEKGKFKISSEDEDVHTKIEKFLINKLGPTGKKIHTGRSRNDQVLTDLRLFTKDSLFSIAYSCLILSQKFISFAGKYEFVPMPGYTHMQKAMPSSVGLWAGSFAESLIDDLSFVASAFDLNNQSPLGSGASYGISIPIDREMTAKLLGFAKVQNNSLYSQNSRGKSHLIVVQSLTQIMITLCRFAQDLLLFTTGEFNFFTVSESVCTGSSIMPQKKNLDVMEILRARTNTVIGFCQIIASIISGLPSGYNADVAETKYPLFKSLDITHSSLIICSLMLDNITPNQQILKKACTSEIFAAHAAFTLSEKGIPFRTAYQIIGKSLDKIPLYDPAVILRQTNHTGGPGNLKLKEIAQEVFKLEKLWKKKQQDFKKKINKLKGDKKNEQ